MIEGVRRLAAYQDLAYARLYLDRLDADPRCRREGRSRRPAARRDRAASRRAHVVRGRDPRRAGQDRSGAVCPHRRATWASSRSRRSRSPNSSNPGVEEFCSVLPPWLARPHSGLRRTSSRARPRALGHGDQYRVGLRLLCAFICSPSCGALRPQDVSLPGGAARDRSVAATDRASRAAVRRACASRSRECARLIKGYGDTHKRGSGNYRLIVAQVIEPGARRRHAGAAGRRRDRQCPHRGAARSRRRSAGQMPCRSGGAAGRTPSPPNRRVPSGMGTRAVCSVVLAENVA